MPVPRQLLLPLLRPPWLLPLLLLPLLCAAAQMRGPGDVLLQHLRRLRGHRKEGMQDCIASLHWDKGTCSADCMTEKIGATFCHVRPDALSDGSGDVSHIAAGGCTWMSCLQAAGMAGRRTGTCSCKIFVSRAVQPIRQCLWPCLLKSRQCIGSKDANYVVAACRLASPCEG